MSKLTPKQQLFVAEYLADLNATKAAIRAGYAEKSARITASKMLTKANIQAAIEEAFQARIQRVEVTADQVVEELARLGFSDMRSFTKWGPDGVVLKHSEDLDEDAARCVAEVSQTVTLGGGSIKFKLHDKKGSLELLGKHLGMFREAPQTVIFPSGTQQGGASLADDIRNIDDHIEELEAEVAEMEAREGIS